MNRTLITLAMALSVAAPAMADEALAKSKNCMACHAIDKKLVGPAYKDVAKKYAGQKMLKLRWSPMSSKAARVFGALFPCLPMPTSTKLKPSNSSLGCCR